MRRRVTLFLAPIIAITLASCANQTPEVTSNTATVQTTVASQSLADAQPSSSQVGVVTGTIIGIREDGKKKGIANAPLYLGDLLKNDQGVEMMGSLDKGTAPKVTADAQGNFIFADVPPGRYSFWLDTPQGALMLNAPNGKDNLIVEVTGGKKAELGDLVFELDIDY